MSFIWCQTLPCDPPCEPKKIEKLLPTYKTYDLNLPIFMTLFRILTESFGKAGSDRKNGFDIYSCWVGKKTSRIVNFLSFYLMKG